MVIAAIDAVATLLTRDMDLSMSPTHGKQKIVSGTATMTAPAIHPLFALGQKQKEGCVWITTRTRYC
ncbi:hypothetical protein CU048_12175 [Beijerinckiaceae bacterium]|nr:hypothetical protein CU048_12175 [Beijerinckiaceae bacterium]